MSMIGFIFYALWTVAGLINGLYFPEQLTANRYYAGVLWASCGFFLSAYVEQIVRRVIADFEIDIAKLKKHYRSTVAILGYAFGYAFGYFVSMGFIRLLFG